MAAGVTPNSLPAREKLTWRAAASKLRSMAKGGRCRIGSPFRPGRPTKAKSGLAFEITIYRLFLVCTNMTLALAQPSAGGKRHGRQKAQFRDLHARSVGAAI